MASFTTSYMAAMRSKLFWMRKRNTAKNTSMKTTSFKPGMLALPSIFWDTLMSWTVNTNESIPHPMGRIACCQTPRTRSYIVTVPACPSICVKPEESTPPAPMDFSMSAWLENIQLQVSRRIPQSHALMSPAMSAKAGLGHASMSAHRSAVAENAMANPRLATACLRNAAIEAAYPATVNEPFSYTAVTMVEAVSFRWKVALTRPSRTSR